MERLACVEVPALPLQLLYERQPEWALLRGAPIAVVREDRPQSPLLWVNPQAHALGMRTGMRYAAALSICGELRAAPVPPEALAACVEQLAQRLRAFTPHVEPAPGQAGTFWLGADGLGGLFASPAAWARLIRADLSLVGYDAVVVVGFTRFGTVSVARGTAALSTERRTVVFATRGAETAAARKVRLEHVGIEPAARDLLGKLGVTTVAQLLALPSGGLKERFGAQVHDLHQAAAGRRTAPLNARAFSDPVEASLDLDFPEVAAAPQLAAIEMLLPDLLERLAHRGLDLDTLLVRRTLDRGAGQLEDALKLAAPSRDLARILELVRLRLEAAPLAAGVTRLVLVAQGVLLAGEQRSLLTACPVRDRDAAERALSRLRAEFGEDAVLRARLREGHLPEAQFAWERLARMVPARPRAGTRGAAGAVRGEVPPSAAILEPRWGARGHRLRLCMVRRIHDRPREIPPLVERDGRSWLLRGTTPGGLDHTCGPYTVCGGWWTGREVHREYHLAEMRGGHIIWVYYDVPRRRWFLQGQVE